MSGIFHTKYFQKQMEHSKGTEEGEILIFSIKKKKKNKTKKPQLLYSIYQWKKLLHQWLDPLLQNLIFTSSFKNLQ